MIGSNPKKKVIFFILMMVIVSFGAVSKNDENFTDEEQISSVIKQFIKSMQKHDIEGIDATLGESVTILEVSDKESKTNIITSDSFRNILPPAGNDDWEKASVSDITVAISKTHPSVAMVSFILKFPLDENELKGIQEIPHEVIKSLNDLQRENLEQMIREKSMIAFMFAIVAKTQGNWKIVSMTFPK